MNKKFKGLKSFIILWSSQAVSSLGSAMTSFSLIIWAYKQQGTASSITWLAVCSCLPSILFCFIAGTLADKWDKKKIMLTSDLIAAMGTASVLFLYTTGNLQIWHLYIVNALISFMNAFQSPAWNVAVSLLAPKEHYVKVSGMQGFSNSLVTVVTPALATVLLSFAGMETVFIIDLATFAIAFCSLLFYIKIPAVPKNEDKKEPFLKSCLSGVNFLRTHTPVLKLILFFSFVNLMASIAGEGIMPALILARSGNDQAALGMVSAAVGIGSLVGSFLVIAAKPAKSKTRVAFIACALSFLLGNVIWAAGRDTVTWIIGSLAGFLPMPFITANLTAIMRTKVPIEMQGRVFSTRDTFQFMTIPIGFALGGTLADNLFEPFMRTHSPVQQFLSAIVGTGKGSGIAVIFLLSGIIGFAANIYSLSRPSYKELDK